MRNWSPILQPLFSTQSENKLFQSDNCACTWVAWGDEIFHLPKVLNNQTQFAETVVRLGPKISETVKKKLSLGPRILQIGGFTIVFMQIFSVEKKSVERFWLLVYKVCELSERFELSSTSNISSMESTIKEKWLKPIHFFPSASSEIVSKSPTKLQTYNFFTVAFPRVDRISYSRVVHW